MNTPQSIKYRAQQSILVGWVSIILNLILFGIKYFAGIVSGSVALIADAWHTLSDSISSILVVGGATLSKKPADKDHPFGHGRYELIVTIIIGCLLIWIAYNFFVESIYRLVHREAAFYGVWAIVATILSIIVKEGMAQYAFRVAKKTDSKILNADGWHHRSDAISSVVILVGIILGRKVWWADGVLGIIVSLLILYTAYKIIRESSDIILGIKPSEDILKKLIHIINETAGDNVYPHHFHLHDYINHKELTFHIYLPDDYSIYKAHEITNLIEDRIEKEMNFTATIHVEPREQMLKGKSIKP